MIRQSTKRLIGIKYLFILIAMFSSCSLLLACKVSSVDLYVGATADANDIKDDGLTSVDIPVGETAWFYAECEVTENPDSNDIIWEYDLDGDGYYDDGGDTTVYDVNYVEFSAVFSEVGDCNVIVRAHLDNGYDSPGAVSNTCTVTAVGVKEVVGDPNNSGPLYVIAGTTVDLEAIPDPNTATFPDGEPTWKITTQPAGSDPNLSFTGEYATFSTDPNDPNALGEYVIEATCGTSSDSIILRVCSGPHPTNFHQTNVFGSTDPTQSNGVMIFFYEWESTSGHLSHLTNCTGREYVDYPGTSSPYFWPDPPWDEDSLDPTTFGLSDMTDGQAQDQHSTGDFEKPYGTAGFSATQRYEFNCNLCMTSGEYETMLDVGSIEREVVTDPNSPSGYLYHITKSASEAKTYLPE